jgi:hypothetical protein
MGGIERNNTGIGPRRIKGASKGEHGRVLGDDMGESGDLLELKGTLDHADNDKRVQGMKKSNSGTHDSGMLSTR